MHAKAIWMEGQPMCHELPPTFCSGVFINQMTILFTNVIVETHYLRVLLKTAHDK